MTNNLNIKKNFHFGAWLNACYSCYLDRRYVYVGLHCFSDVGAYGLYMSVYGHASQHLPDKHVWSIMLAGAISGIFSVCELLCLFHFYPNNIVVFK